MMTLATKSKGRSTFGRQKSPTFDEVDRVQHDQLWWQCQQQQMDDELATNSKVDNIVNFWLCQLCRLSTLSPAALTVLQFAIFVTIAAARKNSWVVVTKISGKIGNGSLLLLVCVGNGSGTMVLNLLLGSTLQWALGRGLLCLAPLLCELNSCLLL